MQCFISLYGPISIKLTLQLVVFCFLLSSAQLTIATTEIIQADKVSNSQQTLNAKELSIRLTPIEREWLKKNPNIKVAVKSGWMPIEFRLESEKHQGISLDYLTSLANLLQINFVITNYVDNIQPEEADIISGVSNKNLKNSKYRLLNQPFLFFPSAIYTNKYVQRKTKIDSLDNLSGLRVAVFKNGPVGENLRTSYPELKLVYVDIADEAFEELRSGRVDAYVGNEILIDYHIAFNRIKFAEKAGLTPFTSSVSMAVRGDYPELASILEKGLSIIEADNKEILQKWSLNDSKTNHILITVITILSVLFLFGSVRFYRLKQVIKKKDIESQKKIWHQANFDYVTNLPNRHMLNNCLEHALASSNKSNLPVGLLYIDLDNFKRVNDQSGHTVGDKLLAEAAARISKSVKSTDTTARIGGDEFMVILNELNDIYSLEKTCQKILNELEKPFLIDKNVFHISTSIGVALYPEDSQSAKSMLSHADQALYEAKKQGRNRFQFFTQSMKTASQDRLTIFNDLSSAILNQQFAIYYQPILNLKDSSISKAEALIRWNHPIKGFISPIDFIPIAEETGLINEIGQWVFHQALNDLSFIRENIDADFQISINVSPYQFQHPDNLLNWIEAINLRGIPGSSISLEITEGLLLEASVNVLTTLSILQKSGIELSIDDFGTGYSALAYLKKFDINYVKIDKSFIQNLESDNYDAVLCGAIIDMAQKLGMKVVAEGIETNAQKNLLRKFECDYGQGYLFARPGTLDQLIEHIETSKKVNLDT